MIEEKANSVTTVVGRIRILLIASMFFMNRQSSKSEGVGRDVENLRTEKL